MPSRFPHGRFAYEIIPEDDPARKGGYVYRLTENFSIDVPIAWEKPEPYGGKFLSIESIGGGWSRITALVGYCWDGPSGPTLDTADFILPSLPHDEVYQFFREGVLDRKRWRSVADMILRELSAEQGMGFCRRWIDWAGVRVFAGGAAKK